MSILDPGGTFNRAPAGAQRHGADLIARRFELGAGKSWIVILRAHALRIARPIAHRRLAGDKLDVAFLGVCGRRVSGECGAYRDQNRATENESLFVNFSCVS